MHQTSSLGALSKRKALSTYQFHEKNFTEFFLIGDIEEELELAKGVSGMKIETLVSDLHLLYILQNFKVCAMTKSSRDISLDILI